MRKSGVLLAGLGVALVSLLASAPANARNLYFDIWCQEQGHSKERCDQRARNHRRENTLPHVAVLLSSP